MTDMAPMRRSKPHAGAVIQPEPAAFGLFHGNPEPLAPPDPPGVVDAQTGALQRFGVDRDLAMNDEPAPLLGLHRGAAGAEAIVDQTVTTPTRAVLVARDLGVERVAVRDLGVIEKARHSVQLLHRHAPKVSPFQTRIFAQDKLPWAMSGSAHKNEPRIEFIFLKVIVGSHPKT